MIFDQLVSTICMYSAIKAGCPEAFKAAGAQTQISKNIDESEQEIVRFSTKEVYTLVGKKTVEYSIATGFVANSLITKTIQIQAPFKPFADEIHFDGSDNDSPPRFSVGLNWKWNLP